MHSVSLARGSWLVAVVLVVGALFLAQDARPVSAAETKIYFTYSTSSPSPETNIILNPDGAPVDLYVWVENITDPQGMASFSVDVIFDPALVTVTAMAEDVAFLTSTGRQELCVPPVIGPVAGHPDGYWHANVACASWVPGPPLQPVQGSGLLAAFTLQPGPAYGSAPLTNNSFIMDAGYVIPPSTIVPPEEITATVMSATAQVAKCADVNSDGAVSGLDFFSLLNKFNTSQGDPEWDPSYDFNEDGSVTGLDLFILLGQFNALCTQ